MPVMLKKVVDQGSRFLKINGFASMVLGLLTLSLF